DPLLEEFSGELTHINPLFDFEADLGETESLMDDDRSLTSYPNSPIENVDHFVPETFKATFTNPLFEFDSEFTLISENPLFDTQTEDSDEPTMEQEFTTSLHVNDSF
ncbi:hypothetical protein, partial [Salmonella enterica]|uniref:hypothetical protein n=1 Tax=Salmonella enterica TaxID=28901 RepID=UPI0020C1E776